MSPSRSQHLNSPNITAGRGIFPPCVSDSSKTRRELPSLEYRFQMNAHHGDVLRPLCQQTSKRTPTQLWVRMANDPRMRDSQKVRKRSSSSHPCVSWRHKMSEFATIDVTHVNLPLRAAAWTKSGQPRVCSKTQPEFPLQVSTWRERTLLLGAHEAVPLRRYWSWVDFSM